MQAFLCKLSRFGQKIQKLAKVECIIDNSCIIYAIMQEGGDELAKQKENNKGNIRGRQRTDELALCAMNCAAQR